MIRLNSNFEFAYTQIGRALCWEERYEEAMAYFKKGNYRGSEVFESDGYNKAFTEYRFAAAHPVYAGDPDGGDCARGGVCRDRYRKEGEAECPQFL